MEVPSGKGCTLVRGVARRMKGKTGTWDPPFAPEGEDSAWEPAAQRQREKSPRGVRVLDGHHDAVL